MIPKDPVYTLQGAIERIKDAMPDEDAEGWLRDAIAADRVRWAYVWNENQGSSCPSFIEILPMAANLEDPRLEIDWSAGMAIVHHRRRPNAQGASGFRCYRRRQRQGWEVVPWAQSLVIDWVLSGNLE